MKKCIKCGELKDYSEFHKRASRSDGMAPYCKCCKKVIAYNSYCAREEYREVRRQGKKMGLVYPKGSWR